jgi:tryptophan-rich sensory protein
MQADVRSALDRLANSRGRSARHVLIGVGIASAAMLASAVAARLSAREGPSEVQAYSDYEAMRPPAPVARRPVLSMVWPPLFVALTMSGIRIWNAPKSAARAQALGLWGAVQALNAAWMALGPRRLIGQLVTALTALGASMAYVWRARRVDPPAANMVAPYVGWVGVANVLTEELWRKTPKPTIH